MIDVDRIDKILKESISFDGKIIEGIVNSYGVDTEKIEPYRKEIVEMIEQLPYEFISIDENGGGGWSFLNLCQTRDGVQWTGLHLTCEKLYIIAAALGLAEIPLPRELWPALPGGVPYMTFRSEVKT